MRIYIFSSKFYLPITAKAFKFAILNYYLLEVYITQGKLQLINMKSVFFFLPQLSSMTRFLFLFQEKIKQNKTKIPNLWSSCSSSPLAHLTGNASADQVLP